MKRFKLTSLAGLLIGMILCIGPLASILFGIVSLGWLTAYHEPIAITILLLSVFAFAIFFLKERK